METRERLIELAKVWPRTALPVYLIGLGYPADRPLRPARRPFDEVVHWDRW